MQLDADIEFKIASLRLSTQKAGDQIAPSQDSDEDDETATQLEIKTEIDDQAVTGDELIESLYERFQSLTVEENKFCEKNFPQKVNQKRKTQALNLLFLYIKIYATACDKLSCFYSVCFFHFITLLSVLSTKLEHFNGSLNSRLIQN